MHVFSPYLSCFMVSQKPVRGRHVFASYLWLWKTEWMTKAIIKKMPSLKLTHSRYNP